MICNGVGRGEDEENVLNKSTICCDAHGAMFGFNSSTIKRSGQTVRVGRMAIGSGVA